jgi:hypothetical protein
MIPELEVHILPCLSAFVLVSILEEELRTWGIDAKLLLQLPLSIFIRVHILHAYEAPCRQVDEPWTVILIEGALLDHKFLGGICHKDGGAPMPEVLLTLKNSIR